MKYVKGYDGPSDTLVQYMISDEAASKLTGNVEMASAPFEGLPVLDLASSGAADCRWAW